MDAQDLEKKSIFILISHQPDIDKVYLHPIDPDEAKYQLLINKRECIGLTLFKNSKIQNELSMKLSSQRHVSFVSIFACFCI